MLEKYLCNSVIPNQYPIYSSSKCDIHKTSNMCPSFHPSFFYPRHHHRTKELHIVIQIYPASEYLAYLASGQFSWGICLLGGKEDTQVKYDTRHTVCDEFNSTEERREIDGNRLSFDIANHFQSICLREEVKTLCS